MTDVGGEFKELWETCMMSKRIFLPSEERSLLKEIKNGSIDAQNELMMAYLWLAVSLAISQEENTAISPMELAEEAVDELRISIESYDSEDETLTFYLTKRIKGRLTEVIKAARTDLSGFSVMFYQIAEEKIEFFQKQHESQDLS